VTEPVEQSPHMLFTKRSIGLLGIGLVAAGLLFTDIFKALPATASAQNALILLLLLAATGIIRTLTPLRFVDAMPLVMLLVALRYLGAIPILAVLLILGAAIVIGNFFNLGLGKLGRASSSICGIAMLTAATGWLLPFPIHFFLVYLLVLGAIAIAGRRSLLHTFGCFAHQWRQATRSAPLTAAFAITAVALCAIALLPPTIQFDDLALHLLLPEQLVTIGHDKMDVASQAWATAPWASDVLQGYVAVLSGRESRGAANGLWLVLTLLMLWNLGAEVGLKASLRWFAISLYATLPLVTAVYGGMQAETAITATALTLVTLTARMVRARNGRALPAFMVVSGLLMALKPTQALLVVPLALVVLVHIGPRNFLTGAIPRLPIALLICGSSYFYAWYITGNPIFPLFNGVFRSPFASPTNLDDPRWHQGLSWDSLWQLTFHTQNYLESFSGAFGFTLLALVGCVLLGLLLPRIRYLILGLLCNLVSAFAAIQYARYILPAIVPLIPLALLAWQHIKLQRVGELVLAGVAILNSAFIPNSSYMLTNGLYWTLLGNINRSPAETSALIERKYAVENLVAQHLSLAFPQGYSLYLAYPARPFTAPFQGQALAPSVYDPGLQLAATKADEDPTGNAWLGLFERTGMTHVLTFGPVKGALGASLRHADAINELTVGNATLWRLCGSDCALVSPHLLDRRDLSKQLFP
jgi:hypothetical protein